MAFLHFLHYNIIAMSQAYIYPKQRSPYWYIQYTDAEGRKHDKSTGLRVDDPNDTIKAKELRARLEAEAYKTGARASGSWDWVEAWMKRHCKTESTLERYRDAWKWLAQWLQVQRIHSPRQLTYKKGISYLDWRVKAKKKNGKSAGRNTAILELKLLSQILDEAVRMEEADANPLASLDVSRDDPKEKPEMSEKEIQKILSALNDEPEWMQICFNIALATGCRLKETRLHVNSIKLNENKITFGSPKGGKKRAFSIPIPKRLLPMLTELKKKHSGWIFDFPFQPSRRWQQFFIKVKLSHLTFHCTRVTFVSRLHRAGVQREVVMRLVNHANELIHKVYEREKVDDLVPWMGKIEEAMDAAFDSKKK